MRLALLLPIAALLVAGCGTTNAPIPAVVKAPPQTASLDWRESYPVDNAALVFGASAFRVTPGGWSADVSIENRSQVSWEVGVGVQRVFGVLLFPNADLDELERRNKAGELPAIRQATSYRPALPRVLAPGKVWQGTIAAPGALAGGLWVRLSFGSFTSVGKPPKGAQPQVVWFTDHAHQLDQVLAEPA